MKITQDTFINAAKAAAVAASVIIVRDAFGIDLSKIIDLNIITKITSGVIDIDDPD